LLIRFVDVDTSMVFKTVLWNVMPLILLYM